MKRHIVGLMLGGMAMVASPAAAQVTVGADLVSTYVFRGFDVTDAPAIQPWATVALGTTGLSVSGWGSWALENRDETKGTDEIDLTVAYARPVGLATIGLGYIAYMYPNGADGSTTQEVYGSVGLGVPFAPTLSVFYDFDSDGLEGDDEGDGYEGLYASLGAARSIPVGMPLDLGASIGYADNSGMRGGEAGLNDFNIAAGLPIPFGPVTVTPTLGWSHLFGIDDVDDSSESTVWAKIQGKFTL